MKIRGCLAVLQENMKINQTTNVHNVSKVAINIKITNNNVTNAPIIAVVQEETW